jgi:hypothetical protein
MYDHVKDSGQRQLFGTGAVRDTAEGKGRYDLLPTYALQRLAQHFENGSKKYGDENWRKGIPLRRFIDSAIRHLFKYLEGQRDEDHAIAAAWNILAMVETEQMIERSILPPELDNLPQWVHSAGDVPFDEQRMPEHDLEPAEALMATPIGQKVFGSERAPHRGIETWPDDSFETIQDEFFGNDAFNLIPDNLMGAPVDLDACGTIDGVNPLPFTHESETARRFNVGELYGTEVVASDTANRPSDRVRDFFQKTVQWVQEN